MAKRRSPSTNRRTALSGKLSDYGPMDHDVTWEIIKKLGPGMAACSQLVDGRNMFRGYVAFHLAKGGDWIEVTRASTRSALVRKLKLLPDPKEGVAHDESDQSPAGDGNSKPR